jgi:hypothetical protein
MYHLIPYILDSFDCSLHFFIKRRMLRISFRFLYVYFWNYVLILDHLLKIIFIQVKNILKENIVL